MADPVILGTIAGLGALGGFMGSRAQAKGARDAANISAQASREATAAQERMFNRNVDLQEPWRQAGVSSLADLLRFSGQAPQWLRDKYTTTNMVDANDANFDAAAYLRANPDVAASSAFKHDPFSHWEKYGKNEGRKLALQNFDEQGFNTANAEYQKTNPLSSLLENTPGYQFRMEQGNKALERSAAARGGLLSGRQLMAQQRFGQGLASDEYGNQWNRLASLAGIGQTATNNLGTMGANYANAIGNIGMTNAANMGNAALAGANARGSFYQGLGNTAGQALGWSQLLRPSGGGGADFWGDAGYSNAGF